MGVWGLEQCGGLRNLGAGGGGGYLIGVFITRGSYYLGVYIRVPYSRKPPMKRLRGLGPPLLWEGKMMDGVVRDRCPQV